MTTIPFSFNRDGNENETLVLFPSDGQPRILGQGHANFAKIKSALTDPHAVDVDEAQVLLLADAAATAIAELTRLSERVMIKGDTIYFDSTPMDSKLTRHLVRMIQEDDTNFGGYVAFLENIMANPSEKSRKGLFRFLNLHGLTITPDGCFIGYKGVGADGKSLTAGAQDVSVTYEDGHVEVHKGHIPYPVGAVIEMDRELVDPDRNRACSVGLHIGSHEYATGWGQGGQFLTVKVNPRDVVEVPKDSGESKIRAHRMTVVELNSEGTHYTGTSFGVDLAGGDDGDLGDLAYADDDDTCQECGGDGCDACDYWGTV